MQAAAAAPVQWWESATAPWWAAPVSTLLGALLAWGLARLTSGRAEKAAATKETIALKREAYSELWAAALEHTALVPGADEKEGRRALVRAMEQILTIELLAPQKIHDAAKALVTAMMNITPEDGRGAAMAKFRVAVAEELKLTK